jgi:NADH-quinone oxidoreductase subunit N
MDTYTLDLIRSSLAATLQGLPALASELWLAGTVLLLVMGAAFDRQGRGLPWLALLGVTISSLVLALVPTAPGLAWEGMVLFDQIGRWARGLLLFSGFITLLWVAREPKAESFRPEFYPLLLAMLLGTQMMVMAVNLLLMYLAIELVSISSYLLTVHRRQTRGAAEGGMKYILFGAFASALMLYGISWWYGLTGSLALGDADALARFAAFPETTQLLVLVLILAGLLFKIAAVPMHFWAPDVYQGTSYPVATFFSVAPKVAGILMLLHLLRLTTDLPVYAQMQVILLLVAVASMSLGNLAALWQTDLKRLLAYSSVAQSGFMLIAAACRSDTGEAAVLFYLTIYCLMNLSVFILAAGLARSRGSDDLRQLDGLAFRFPLATIGMTIGLVALVGLPPTSGFIAKWYVLMAGIEQVGDSYPTLWVVVMALAVINTVVSLFYYLRIPARMVLRLPLDADEDVAPLPGWAWLGMVLALPVLVLGFLGFDEVMNWIQLGLWNV